MDLNCHTEEEGDLGITTTEAFQLVGFQKIQAGKEYSPGSGEAERSPNIK